MKAATCAGRDEAGQPAAWHCDCWYEKAAPCCYCEPDAPKPDDGEPWTPAQFKAHVGRHCENGWDDLAPWLDVESCDCGESYCHGWQTVYQRRASVSDHNADYAVTLNGHQIALLITLADKEMQRITRIGMDVGVATIKSGHASLVHKTLVALRRPQPPDQDYYDELEGAIERHRQQVMTAELWAVIGLPDRPGGRDPIDRSEP